MVETSVHSRHRGIYQKQCFPCLAVCVTSQTGLQWPPLDSPTWEDPGSKGCGLGRGLTYLDPVQRGR